jgi:CRISPR-associated exonuclease Cas4
MIADGHTPPPVYMAACKRCSLLDLCGPKRLEHPPSIARWLERQLSDVPDVDLPTTD